MRWSFTTEDDHLASRTALRRIRSLRGRFAVPSLFHSELVHALARGSSNDEGFVKSALDRVFRLGLRVMRLSDRDLHRTAELACSGLSGYDATFVALAESLGGKWLTADEEAAGVIPDVAVTLREWVSDR